MIWAQTPSGVIGAGGTLAWHLPEDMQHFRETTWGAVVLHGRSSYEALPPKFRPLPGRRNLVLTRRKGYQAPGAQVVHSLAEAWSAIGEAPAWVLGGGQVYAEALPWAHHLVVTEVDTDVEGDTFAPQLGEAWRVVSATQWLTSKTGLAYRIQRWEPLPGASASG